MVLARICWLMRHRYVVGTERGRSLRGAGCRAAVRGTPRTPRPALPQAYDAGSAGRHPRGEVQGDLRADQVLVVAEACLDVPGEIVDQDLGQPGLQRVKSRPGHRARSDLVVVEADRHVGVDVADVHTQDLGALASELGPGGVGV